MDTNIRKLMPEELDKVVGGRMSSVLPGYCEYPSGQRHGLCSHHCRTGRNEMRVDRHRPERMACCEDRKPGRMGVREVQRDHNRIILIDPQSGVCAGLRATFIFGN